MSISLSPAQQLIEDAKSLLEAKTCAHCDVKISPYDDGASKTLCGDCGPKFAKPKAKSPREKLRKLNRDLYGVHKEEVEQIDELSKKTLSSYATKAQASADELGTSAKKWRNDAASMRRHASRIENGTANPMYSGGDARLERDNADWAHGQSDIRKKLRDKRLEGVKRARAKLTSEAMLQRAAEATFQLMDEAEQLDEISKETKLNYYVKASTDVTKKMQKRDRMTNRAEGEYRFARSAQRSQDAGMQLYADPNRNRQEISKAQKTGDDLIAKRDVLSKKVSRRLDGLVRAQKSLTEEDVELLDEAKKPGSWEHFMHHGTQAMKHARTAIGYDRKAVETGNRHSKVDYDAKANASWDKSTKHLNHIVDHYGDNVATSIQDDFDEHNDATIKKLVHRTWKHADR